MLPIGLFLEARRRYVPEKSEAFAKDTRLALQVALFRFMDKSQDAENWIGTAKTHGTTPQGDAWLVIEIADGVAVGTWQTRIT
jgi:hypothetical protein